ncbi:class I SAM-dependent methyltransferase [Cereibacter changlensis]|uniref:Class I SAM-dependent methyltransferase n=1 Tax=Cereibacter changlensis TaxID=402884 RepID=A0A4U0Z041_9RHOB|nr:SAM-dependent methyltransferase [Cereibacter changlensis]TKA94763.1 class I SAM-dependent methyltransferase [Cereibacter changlensis]
MTPLADLLIRRIEAAGPLSLADYMADCLLHPEHGYYATREPFGAAGDFTTAPEISQMFGELLGLCLAQSWLDQGAPEAFTLAELGPGRGTLMADVLRATRGVPGFHAAARVVLVEASARLRAVQRETLAAHPTDWVEGVSALPDRPLFLLANEFFDALPIRQFVRDSEGWRERVVGLAEGRLSFGLTGASRLAALEHRLADTGPGEVVEISPSAAPIMAGIAERIATHGGLALVTDYGGWRSRRDTLQALRAHRFADPLEEPGEADLTAHVDFEALAQAAAPCATSYTEQGALLLRLGIAARAAKLAASLQGDARESHLAAYRRLTDPAEMGTLFKALAVSPPQSAPPPGFA